MRTIILYLLTATLFCGCTSRIPEPIAHTYSQQKKMQASQHWEVLAKDLANRINNELILSGNLDATVFVKPTCGDEATPCEPNETSSFNEAFRDLLITGLYDFGIPTASAPLNDAIEVLYKVQVVHHNSSRTRTIQPGLLTALSSAVIVLRNAPSELIVLAAGVAADVANTSFTTRGQYEIIITTSIVNRGTYLFRASDIYYINDKDFYHYQDHKAQTKTINLSTSRNIKENQFSPPFPTVEQENPAIKPEQNNDKTGI